MRLFTSFTLGLVQLTSARRISDPDDYDLDFWQLIKRLEELKAKEEKYKVASHFQKDRVVLLDVPTKLKKVGEGVKVEVEKTSDDKTIGRKKQKNLDYVTYDNYYDYSMPDYNYAESQPDDGDDYMYFYPDDTYYTTSTTELPPTTTTKRPRPVPPSARPIAQKPNYKPNISSKPSQGLISAPKPPSSAQSERQSFSDVEYEYEYDELGMKRKKKKKTPRPTYDPNLVQYGQYDHSNPNHSNQYGANQYGSNQQNSNQYDSNQYGSNQYGSNQYGSNQYGSNHYGSNKQNSNQYGSNQYGSNAYATTQHHSQYASNQQNSNQYGSSEYGSNNYDTGFECWECLSANSYEHCLEIGKTVTCNGGSIGCNIEVRSRRYSYTAPREIEKIHMGCKQMKACIVEHKYNGVNSKNWHPQCFEEDSPWPALLQWGHSTCRQCCAESNCNYQWMVPGYRLDTTDEWEDTAPHAKNYY